METEHLLLGPKTHGVSLFSWLLAW